MSWESEQLSFHERRRIRIKQQYDHLKSRSPDVYRQCLQMAEGVVLNGYRMLSSLTEQERLSLSAAIEERMIAAAMLGADAAHRGEL